MTVRENLVRARRPLRLILCGRLGAEAQRRFVHSLPTSRSSVASRSASRSW